MAAKVERPATPAPGDARSNGLAHGWCAACGMCTSKTVTAGLFYLYARCDRCGMVREFAPSPQVPAADLAPGGLD